MAKNEQAKCWKPCVEQEWAQGSNGSMFIFQNKIWPGNCVLTVEKLNFWKKKKYDIYDFF